MRRPLRARRHRRARRSRPRPRRRVRHVRPPQAVRLYADLPHAISARLADLGGARWGSRRWTAIGPASSPSGAELSLRPRGARAGPPRSRSASSSQCGAYRTQIAELAAHGVRAAGTASWATRSPGTRARVGGDLALGARERGRRAARGRSSRLRERADGGPRLLVICAPPPRRGRRRARCPPGATAASHAGANAPSSQARERGRKRGRGGLDALLGEQAARGRDARGGWRTTVRSGRAAASKRSAHEGFCARRLARGGEARRPRKPSPARRRGAANPVGVMIAARRAPRLARRAPAPLCGSPASRRARASNGRAAQDLVPRSGALRHRKAVVEPLGRRARRRATGPG